MRLALMLLALAACDDREPASSAAVGGSLVYIDDADAGVRCYSWRYSNGISCVKVR